MVLKYKNVLYNNIPYTVINVKYKNKDLPLLLDRDDFHIIQSLDPSLKCNKYGSVCFSHTFNNNTRDVFIHEIIMALKNRDTNSRNKNSSILHINRIGLDNRRVNLIYDVKNKNINKNIKKKKRIITLPKNSGILPDELPTFVWYMKPNNYHGERFMVSIGDIKWKTTSKKNISLRYKLEQAKSFLRNLKNDKPELFESFSMNGDYNKHGFSLITDFFNIIKLAGYNNIDDNFINNNTDFYLKPYNNNNNNNNNNYN